MEDKNQHVTEYIDYYCNLRVSPEYALMIKGAWGCGKTHLVKEFISVAEKEEQNKFLSISLYGINSFEDIEAKFFQILHPVLSKKGVVLAGQLAKGFLRGALKIDFDGDGKAESTLNAGIPDIDIPQYLTDTSNHILVFDDLERCSIDLKLLLGYINHFVEKGGYKVIILCDEEKLISNKEYLPIKEKLIGKTLEVIADFDKAFETFTSTLIGDEELKSFISLNKSIIKNRFIESSYNNLRSLRKSFLEFTRVWDVLDEQVKSKKELLKHILDFYIILSMEIYSGNITANEIYRLLSMEGRYPMHGCKEDPAIEKYRILEEKYDIGFTYEPLLSKAQWVEFFDKGIINKKQTNENLKVSRYFHEEMTPDWMKLWNIFSLEDHEFQALYESIEQSFIKREYTTHGEIKHVMGMLLSYSRIKLISKSIEVIKQECLEYIDDAIFHDLIDISRIFEDPLSDYSSCFGYQYKDSDSLEFKEICSYLEQKINDTCSRKLTSQAKLITDALEHEPSKLSELLLSSDEAEVNFRSLPILQTIDVNLFLEIIMNSSNVDKRTIGHVLKKRYDNNIINHKLIDELPWLENLKDNMGEKIAEITLASDVKQLSTVFLEGFEQSLGVSIGKLNECNSQ